MLQYVCDSIFYNPQMLIFAPARVDGTLTSEVTRSLLIRKFKVKVMAKVKPDDPIWGLAFNR